MYAKSTLGANLIVVFKPFAYYREKLRRFFIALVDLFESIVKEFFQAIDRLRKRFDFAVRLLPIRVLTLF